MGKVYDEFEQLSMGGNGKAPLGFAEAVYQANINDRLENMPGLKEHFDNTIQLSMFLTYDWRTRTQGRLKRND